MWDKPHLLRMLTIALVAVSLSLVAYAVLRQVLQLPVFRVRTVQLTQMPDKVDVQQVNRLIKSAVNGSFFTVDLVQTRRAFEQLPWVRKVSVRRQFPWGLEVTLEEHVPLAHWNDSALVNTHGEVFEGQSDKAMPNFYGEPDMSKQMAEMYATFSEQLAAVDRSVAQLSLSARFAWQLKLDNGMTLELGREQMQQRVARFVAVYPYSLATLGNKVGYVDLRYRNGFAVSQGFAVNQGLLVKRAANTATGSLDKKRNSASRG